ncbi:ABC transporter substrate-binding protein [Parachitinimonas caeni]|uniref:ABC transporter substrate-binding protein n=1 Tax=Parachitinimonas caeni TaxID=3031301 RepID=A0ABT7DW85_9NEIS|nr:ABC transporter substrate-binding protein [Parachitinimonas caeni]MDK2124324.1 ABC transporter substrate-binding protein [Parachitinimonas caeni]
MQMTAAGLFGAFSSPYAVANAAPFRIMLMLYRGQTEAEKGFQNYLKSRHIPVEYIIRDANEDKQKIRQFIDEARTLRPDLIYSFGTTLTKAIVGPYDAIDKSPYINDIPVVFNIVADPVGAKLVPRLSASGRNLTGTSHLVPMPAQLKALINFKTIRRLGAIYNPDEANSLLAIEQLKRACLIEKIELILSPVVKKTTGMPDKADLNNSVNQLLAQKPEMIYLPSDSFIIANARQIIEPALLARTPAFSATEAPIRQQGALAGLVSRYYNVGEFAAHKAIEILVQKKAPSQIPIEVLNRFSYLINMQTARRLGTFPPVAIFRFAEIVDKSPV